MTVERALRLMIASPALIMQLADVAAGAEGALARADNYDELTSGFALERIERRGYLPDHS